MKAVIVDEGVRDAQTSSATCHLVEALNLPGPVLFQSELILTLQQSQLVTLQRRCPQRLSNTRKFGADLEKHLKGRVLFFEVKLRRKVGNSQYLTCCG